MQILIVCHTHGDETIGTKIHRFCKARGIDTVIANKEATKKNKRYIDEDLNRVFGKKSNTYEGKNWPKIKKIMQKYDIVLDVHSTTTGKPNAAIITKDTPNRLLKNLLCDNVVRIEMPNSLIHHAPKIGIALEYGGNDKETESRVIAAIENLQKPHVEQKKSDPNFWEVSEIVPKPEGFKLSKKFNEYEPIDAWQIIAQYKSDHAISYPKKYYSFLLGHENYTEIFGFLLKKIDYKSKI